MSIHPSAVIDPAARLGANVTVGPFCTIGAGVTLGDGCVLDCHVHILGPTEIGRRNRFHPMVTIGGPPQDLRPQAPDGKIVIGDDNVFRECVTVNAPKRPGGATRIGSRNSFFYSSHVGHDSLVHDDVVLDSGFDMGGHSEAESGAHCGPHGGIHQFATVGRRCRIRSHTPVTEDAPPYMICDGNHYRVIGVHRAAVRNLPPDRVRALESAYELIYTSDHPREEALSRLEAGATAEVSELIHFIRRSRAGKMGRYRESLR